MDPDWVFCFLVFFNDRTKFSTNLEGVKVIQRPPQDLGDSYFLHNFLVCVVFHSQVTIREQMLCVEGLWGTRGRQRTRKMKSESSGLTVSFATLDNSLTYRVFLTMHQGRTLGLCFSARKE